MIKKAVSSNKKEEGTGVVKQSDQPKDKPVIKQEEAGDKKDVAGKVIDSYKFQSKNRKE